MLQYDRDLVFVFKYSFCHKNTKTLSFTKQISGGISQQNYYEAVFCAFFVHLCFCGIILFQFQENRKCKFKNSLVFRIVYLLSLSDFKLELWQRLLF